MKTIQRDHVRCSRSSKINQAKNQTILLQYAPLPPIEISKRIIEIEKEWWYDSREIGWEKFELTYQGRFCRMIAKKY